MITSNLRSGVSFDGNNLLGFAKNYHEQMFDQDMHLLIRGAPNSRGLLIARSNNNASRSNNASANSDSVTLESLQRSSDSSTSSWRKLRTIMRAASTKRVTSATQILIQHGLLLTSRQWIATFIALGVDVKSIDDDGISNIRIAIAIGWQCTLQFYIVEFESDFVCAKSRATKASSSG